jgi:hypothetical protein
MTGGPVRAPGMTAVAMAHTKVGEIDATAG